MFDALFGIMSVNGRVKLEIVVTRGLILYDFDIKTIGYLSDFFDNKPHLHIGFEGGVLRKNQELLG